MRNYSFQFEVERLVTMFISAMDDIVVKRYNVHKNVRDQIKVRFVYAPKQRVLHDLLDRAQNLQLPVAAVYIGGISRDPNRVFNKIAGSSFYTTDPRTIKQVPQPVPIDLTLNLSFLTRYQSDMDQCISNFIPYCDPYFVISWRIPEMPDHEIRAKVEWSGQIAFDYPVEIASTSVARVRADTSFVVKGWIFKAFPEEPFGEILKINTDFSTAGVLTSQYSLDYIEKNLQHSTDRALLSAVPQPKGVDKWLTQVSATPLINVFGASFFDVQNVYVSGTTFSYSSAYNPFATSTSLSGLYPSFSAVKVLSGDIIYTDENVITLKMPSADSAGFYDIILENYAGYGTLMNNVRVNTYNPYLSGTLEYAAHIPYNPPYLSGIEVKLV
jgi:hypothetical protein